MIVTEPLMLPGEAPLPWMAPSGWEDLPPPPGQALVLSRQGRVLGRVLPLVPWQEPALDHPLGCGAMDGIRLGWAWATVVLLGVDAALRGGARRQGWPALVACDAPASLRTLADGLRPLEFQRE